MKFHKKPAAPLEALRARAESAVARVAAKDVELTKPEMEKLLYELQLHQAELQIQNEELAEAQVELQRTHDRYYELYDRAPVAYLTLNRAGEIQTINRQASDLLDVASERVIGRRLAAFLRAPEGRALNTHLREIFAGSGKHRCELLLWNQKGRKVPVRIESICVGDPSGPNAECFSVLIDPSDLWSTGEGRRSSHPPGDAACGRATAAIAGSGAGSRSDARLGPRENTVLLVEHDRIGRIALIELLEGSGYRVLSVSGASQALQACASATEPIDLLLSEVGLSEMRGDELATEIARIRPGIKTVLMSRTDDVLDGAWTAVRKPIAFDDLLEIIDGMLAD